MKAVYISSALFLLMLVGIVFSVHYLNNACSNFSNLNIKLENDLNMLDWNKAEEDSNSFFNQWEKNSKNISLFIDHKEMDNINIELWKQKQYISCKNKDEALASNNIMKFFLEHIKILEKISIQNIF